MELDLLSCHHYQDKSDTIELLELQNEVVLFLAPIHLKHILNKYNSK